MGRYVILLILPVIAGVLIAAGAILVSALGQHRVDVRRTLLEARRPNLALSLADAAAGGELLCCLAHDVGSFQLSARG